MWIVYAAEQWIYHLAITGENIIFMKLHTGRNRTED